MESLFGLSILLLMVIGFLGFALEVWAVVHVAQQPEWAWRVAGVDKTTWLILTIVAFFTCFLLSVYYLVAIRPKLEESTRRGPAAAGWWQASDGQWYPPQPAA